MNQKGFVPVLIIVIVAIAAILGGWYYVKKSSAPQPTPQPPIAPVSAPTSSKQAASSSTTQADTSNWKTYMNTQYGVSFKYPANWSANISNLSGSKGEPIFSIYFTETGTPLPKSGNDAGGGYIHADFDISNNPEFPTINSSPLPFSDWIVKYSPTGGDKDVAITISGYPALRRTGNNSSFAGFDEPTVTYYIGRGSYIFRFGAMDQSNGSKNISTLDQILSTFKFL